MFAAGDDDTVEIELPPSPEPTERTTFEETFLMGLELDSLASGASGDDDDAAPKDAAPKDAAPKDAIVDDFIRFPHHECGKGWNPKLLLSNAEVLKNSVKFIDAIKNRHWNIVKQLIQSQLALDVRHDDGMSSLHAAISVRHEGLVRFLMQQGADVDCLDDNGRSPLMFACAHNDVRLVACLTWLHADTTSVTCDTICKRCKCKFRTPDDLELHMLLWDETSQLCPDEGVSGQVGETALHLAVHFHNYHNARMIMRENYKQFRSTLNRMFLGTIVVVFFF
jgi:hypothetical protein